MPVQRGRSLASSARSSRRKELGPEQRSGSSSMPEAPLTACWECFLGVEELAPAAAASYDQAAVSKGMCRNFGLRRLVA